MDDELTPEALAELKAQAERAKELEDKLAAAEKRAKELEEDSNSIDWRKAREKEKRMKEALKEAGKTVNDDGEVIEQSTMTREEMEKANDASFERKWIEKEKSKAFAGLNEADRATAERFYSKAIAGEEVNSDNVTSFIDMAFKMGEIKSSRGPGDRIASTNGAGHSMSQPEKMEYTDPLVANIAAEMSKKFPNQEK